MYAVGRMSCAKSGSVLLFFVSCKGVLIEWLELVAVVRNLSTRRTLGVFELAQIEANANYAPRGGRGLHERRFWYVISTPDVARKLYIALVVDPRLPRGVSSQ